MVRLKMKSKMRFIFVIMMTIFATVSAHTQSIKYSDYNGTFSETIWKMPEVRFYTEGRKVILYGSNAKAKRSVLEDLASWSGANVLMDQIDFKRSLDVTDLLKLKIPSVDFGSPYLSHSLNCHGTTLLTSGYLNVKRYVGEREILFFLKNYCHEVAQPGQNIIAVSYAANRPFHSFTYVSDTISIEKKSVDKGDPVRIVYNARIDESFQFYQCDINKIFECNPLESYFKQQMFEIEKVAYEISIRGQDIHRRSELLHRAQELLARIRSQQKSSCLEEVYVKLESIRDYLDANQGMQFYRNKDSLIFRESPI